MDVDKSNTDDVDLQDMVLNLQYETQHFGFHPRTFIDVVYNVFFENVSSSLIEMQQYLTQEYKEVLPPNVIKTQTDVFLQEILKQLDKSIDKLEVFLNNNVFPFAKHIILPEDEVHIKSPCTKEDDSIVDVEIEELKQKILQEKAKRFTLKKKINEQKEIKADLLSLQNDLQNLLGIAYEKGVNPENIESLYSNLAKLSDFNVQP